MKVKVLEDCSIVVGQRKELVLKAGVHEVKEANRVELDKLVAIGLAEPVKSSAKEA